jgi:hypothetical protein
MTNLGGVVQMLKQEQDRLTKEMKAIGAALSAFGETYAKRTTTRGKISAAGRARIAAAQRARWAKARGEHTNVLSIPKKRTMSASARKRIAAAQRARWAKVRAAKKTA